MLKELEIENLAVIAHARIPFSSALNVFTGETGAGKSILIHGIQAILGQRVTRDIVRTGEKKAVVTALFTDLSPAVCARLDTLSIRHDENEILLMREIAADGGSSARINGHTTTISVLREVGEMLINIHGQHDNQVLLAPECHLGVLDAFGGDPSLLNAYQESFHALQRTARELGRLVRTQQEQEQRRKRLQTLADTVAEAQLKMGEEEALERELHLLEHARGIISALSKMAETADALYADESAVTMLEDAAAGLGAYAEMDSRFAQICARIKTVTIELSDIAEECRGYADHIDLDEARMEAVQNRLHQIRHLCREYNTDADGLVEQAQAAAEELHSFEADYQRIEVLKKERAALLEKVTEQARALYAYRAQTLERFTQAVTAELKFLNMPNVVLTGRHTAGKLTLNGMDSLEFLISANRGEEPKPLAKIASGGELSRIMLALKCVIADRDSIPTLIFDEIDTGVSGKAAQKIGYKLRQVAMNRQVLCVTHLSQIAVMADHHLMIEKNDIDGRTQTHVEVLDEAGRVQEIARIMGGEQPSALLLETAREELAAARRTAAEMGQA